MRLLEKILNFILYSNLWIALAAVCMVAKTVYTMGMIETLPWYHPLYGLSFFATLFIYAGHRIVGLQKNKPFQKSGRYKVIKQFKSHIVIYALIGLLGTMYYSFQLSWNVWLGMSIPALISLAYVFPIFKGGQQRLRDINNVKIFFVALVWMLVAVALPFLDLQHVNNYPLAILSGLEVFLFIFAITIPFDIRDLKVDGHLNVQTLPARYGVQKTKQIAYLLLVLSFIIACLNMQYWEVSTSLFHGLALCIGYGITLLLLFLSHPDRPDYFYTGFLDGTMILIPILVLLG